ncbi:ATP-binding protein [Tenacibaculum finnmarkense]|uniref:AAA family ATPase n=1 Tax=Tenacibaculum finnmarkense TaxID=2781243 RepID=UPI00187B22F2|nr:AAA family ATPase [Tenacibaculum finnmarkense]MBE7649265.1 AAA family ATPase [Tenacibaculum finnmarkense genomovar ulcerans]MCG8808881.1 ATP-binding protein [Tenacibaculum finnmarkense]MCG8819124.1 ATP-binding protein [Tenacibaculum finnmarkense]WCC43976.1 AAA family ATPase [Tenacibaculum finnmarkense]
MKIELNNLGAIKKAELDISKKLTIFCGPNNSGKTYVAFMIYALTKSGPKYFRDSESKSFINELLENGESKYEINIDSLWEYRNKEINELKLSLDNIYGISEDVANHLFANFDLKILETKEEFSSNIHLIDFFSEIELKNTLVEIIKTKKQNFVQLKLKTKSASKENIEILNLFLLSKIYSLIAFHPFTSSYILPVERNSIYTFSKELSIQKQEFLERAQELGSKKSKDPFHYFLKKSTRYPMPIKDGLEIAEDLTNYSKTKSEFYEFALEIENELLQGEVILTKDGDVQFKSNKAKSKRIPIHLTASIVKTLSSLIFYLKYIATKNELIIIDEPELNLHPNNQVTLTRFFAKLINKGFRILISTHSDYIIREINNLIMASSSKKGVKEIATKQGYTEDIKLSHNDVNAYLFNYKTEKSRNVSIQEIDVTETGFDVNTIDKTVDELNEISEELFYSIKYSDDND